jgi:hypothetical protein
MRAFAGAPIVSLSLYRATLPLHFLSILSVSSFCRAQTGLQLADHVGPAKTTARRGLRRNRAAPGPGARSTERYPALLFATALDFAKHA